MGELKAVAIYLIPLIFIVVYYIISHRQTHKQSVEVKVQSHVSGLTEPASLHPIIDPVKCLGCGTCVTACPEQDVLGIINNKAALIAPSHCIGHGACEKACPQNAITLVFGTATRGVDIPELDEFQTTVPGIYIAGELGGMGLIRNAIEQGKQAMAAIKKNSSKLKVRDKKVLDVLMVGAGPAGIAAALYALENKMKYLVVEQDSLGGTVSHFPRGKVVMTAPASLPLVGKVKFKETSKEILLEFWQKIEKDYNLNINYQERLEAISREDDQVLRVTTTAGEYRTKAVLMAIGRRGTPRTLNVPGEDLSKVTYRLIDPQEFRGQHVLVVGGGDSALEAAHSIADEDGAHVVLSYRGESFSRAKEKNREKITAAEARGNLSVYLESQVKQISSSTVSIETIDGPKEIKNNHVIICAGGVLPNALLKDIGILVTTKFGTV